MNTKHIVLGFILLAFVAPLKGQKVVDSAVCRVRMSDPFSIDVSHDGKERQFPFAFKFGKNIFLSYSEHRDAVVASPTDAMMISRNNGKTWKEKQVHPDFYLTSMVQLKDTLYGIVYFTYPVSPKEEKMIYWISTDKGHTWARHEGAVYAPPGSSFKTEGIRGTWGSMLFHRGMQVMADGSIQGTMYGYLEGDQKYRVLWVKSTDHCAHWTVVSTIAAGVPEGDFAKAEGYCEPTAIRVKDASLLCVMRIGSNLPLYQSRSTDNGLTWSKPVPLPGLSADVSQSVGPQLLYLRNGVLALTYGRPGDRVVFSFDGSGYQWNCSTVTHPGETTGYTGIVGIRRNKFLLIGDQGRTGAAEMAIWGRIVKVRK